MVSGISWWLVLLCAASLLVANAVAGVLALARNRRIADKSARLARAGEGAGPISTTAVSRVVPVTVVTGFLGSGKTSLLNAILAQPGDRRICVIENEAGAVSIDHELLVKGDAGQPAAGIYVLQNGCMCCTASDDGGDSDLERVLDQLLRVCSDDSSIGLTVRPTHVVIEASGLADPAPILSTLFRGDIAARFPLDSVVAVVDAKHVAAHLDSVGNRFARGRGEAAARQVAYADVVLINKADAASSAELDAAESAVRAINPTARVQRTTYCVLTPSAADVLLDCSDFGAQGGTGAAAAALRAAVEREPSARPPRAIHDGSIRAITIDASGLALPLRVLQVWLQRLVTAQWRSLFRIKALVWVVDSAAAEKFGGGEGPAVVSAATTRGVDGHAQRGGARRRKERSSTPPRGGRANGRAVGVAQDSTASAPPRLFVVHGVHAELTGELLPTSVAGAEAPSIRPAIVLIGRGLDEASLRTSFENDVAAHGTALQERGRAPLSKAGASRYHERRAHVCNDHCAHEH